MINKRIFVNLEKYNLNTYKYILVLKKSPFLPVFLTLKFFEWNLNTLWRNLRNTFILNIPYSLEMFPRDRILCHCQQQYDYSFSWYLFISFFVFLWATLKYNNICIVILRVILHNCVVFFFALVLVYLHLHFYLFTFRISYCSTCAT